VSECRLERASEHVWWFTPDGRTDRPALAVVAGADASVLLDFGDEGIDLRLGGVTCSVRRVGGDHAVDSCAALAHAISATPVAISQNDQRT
jgi:hypothetical protein